MMYGYQLVLLIQPVVWFLLAVMSVLFFITLFRRKLHVVTIFLGLLSVACIFVVDDCLKKVKESYYLATSDDMTLCIVGSVTLSCFMICEIAFLISSQWDDEKEGKESKWKHFAYTLTEWMLVFLLPFAIMGYSLPFFFLDSIAGMIVGILGELVGIFVLVKLIQKKIKGKEKTTQDVGFELSDEEIEQKLQEREKNFEVGKQSGDAE